ncbi:DEAD/DEAH box helicase family protein [Oceanobacillus caeni]|uniref:DEAD/DEAH box helicase family protein n=1 Tax=Oceanobacillus caeni TaxID=405946 RepID=UPI002149CCCB|nr:DEAD/DEAH box helicase family protein [Oceanobacillus caeni]MCR1833160.1 DEAD/DEAH box helicase family protein [Oceanobacillus caeni]
MESNNTILSKRMYISDIITNEDIKSWNKGEIVTIEAGTGAGKSHFIKTRLFLHAKESNQKILMLVHRLNCLDQFQYEIQKGNRSDVIRVSTYQSIEADARKRKKYDFGEYDYIVCDEFHYFMSDAAFNIYTDLSLKEILNQTNKVRILMSATGDYMEQYLKKVRKIKSNKYSVPFDYSFIVSLNFFYKESVFDDLMEQFIDSGEKAIFFIDSAKDAYQLYVKYKDYCMFNCSKYNKDYYKYVSDKKVNRMLENERFEDDLILITTTTLDAGVNIIDDELFNIVVDVKDIGTLIQCIGRKRLKDSDCINLYVKAITNEQLGGRKTHMMERLQRANYVKEHGTQAYVDKFFKDTNDYSNIVYDNPIDGKVEKVINDMIYFKTKVDISQTNMMLKKDYGYCKYIAWKLGKYNPKTKTYDYEIVEENKEKETLEIYLENVKGKMLFRDDQKKLIDKIDLRVNGRQQKSYKKLNEGLEMINSNYIIIKDIDSRRKLDDGTINPNRKKTYWMVIKSLV